MGFNSPSSRYTPPRRNLTVVQGGVLVRALSSDGRASALSTPEVAGSIPVGRSPFPADSSMAERPDSIRTTGRFDPSSADSCTRSSVGRARGAIPEVVGSSPAACSTSSCGGSSEVERQGNLEAGRFDSPSPRYHYCIVRDDLPRGTLAAQLIHAAGESSERVATGTHAVALAAKDEAHLSRIEAKLQRRGISHTAIREPDSPYNGALMAIGIEPVADRRLVRPITKGLRLLR